MEWMGFSVQVRVKDFFQVIYFRLSVIYFILGNLLPVYLNFDIFSGMMEV